MSTSEKRKIIRKYLKRADNRFLNMVYALMEEYAGEEDELTESHKRILDERIVEHKANPASGTSWKEVKEKLDK